MQKYFAVIAIVALTAFGLSAFAQDKTPAPAKPGDRAPMARLKEDLQLTPDQVAKLKEFAKARQEENKVFGEQMQKLRTEMGTLRQDSQADPNKVNGLIDQMFKMQADRAKAQFKNQKEREKIFTPEQLEKMKSRRPLMMGLAMRGGPMGGFMRGPMGGAMGMGLGFGRGPMRFPGMMRFGRGMQFMQRFMPGMRGMARFGRMDRPNGRGMGMMMRHPGAGRRVPDGDEKKPEVKK
jgi:Spy/CpxP family protein refolding chaperone